MLYGDIHEGHFPLGAVAKMPERKRVYVVSSIDSPENHRATRIS
jgi:hypothetical protein